MIRRRCSGVLVSGIAYACSHHRAIAVKMHDATTIVLSFCPVANVFTALGLPARFRSWYAIDATSSMSAASSTAE
jgi:hypothetical protein